MKKRMVRSTCFCCLFALFLFGCKTPPKKEAEPPAPVQTIKDSGAEEHKTNGMLEAQIAEARQKAVDAGAESFFPNELTVVDIAYREAQTVKDAGGDAAEFDKKAADILEQYRALEQAALAADARKKINDMNFAGYAQADYDAAEKAFSGIEQLFNTGADGKDLYAQAKTAADRYRSVLNAAYGALAQKEREKVIALKKKADEIKASVADETGYANAVAFYTRAEQEFKTGENESAYNNFVTCYGMLEPVYRDVAKKRALAEEALARAKRRVEESDAMAAKADSMVPIEKVESLEPIENTQAVKGAQ